MSLSGAIPRGGRGSESSGAVCWTEPSQSLPQGPRGKAQPAEGRREGSKPGRKGLPGAERKSRPRAESWTPDHPSMHAVGNSVGPPLPQPQGEPEAPAQDCATQTPHGTSQLALEASTSHLLGPRELPTICLQTTGAPAQATGRHVFGVKAPARVRLCRKWSRWFWQQSPWGCIQGPQVSKAECQSG